LTDERVRELERETLAEEVRFAQQMAEEAAVHTPPRTSLEEARRLAREERLREEMARETSLREERTNGMRPSEAMMVDEGWAPARPARSSVPERPWGDVNGRVITSRQLFSEPPQRSLMTSRPSINGQYEAMMDEVAGMLQEMRAHINRLEQEINKLKRQVERR
jgi:exonuclease VII large subunit